MTRDGWDVVVVGAGPAGSAIAVRLAVAGHRLLILDRQTFPRSKPCGECLSPAAVQALDALGVLPRVEAADHALVSGWRIQSGTGAGFSGCFPQEGPGIAIARSTLDQILLDFAVERGAEVRTGVRVIDLIREGNRIVGVRTRGSAGEEEIRARLVVGADGLRSVVVRRLGLLRRAPRLRKVALTAHLRHVPGLSGVGELHLLPWGCIGLAEVGGGMANVTVVVMGDEIPRVAGARDEYFDAATRALPILRDAQRDGPVLATGPFDWPVRRAVADGALLVGDAAGYYDPFTGQGIFRALKGAELAAEVADRALRADDLSAHSLVRYERARRRAFSPGVRLQHVIESFVSRPRLLQAVAAQLAARPLLADTLIAVTGDLRPVRSLWRPRMLASMWR